MKTCTPLVTSLFAMASFPLWAQQPPPATQPDNPATQQSPSSSSMSPEATTAPMSPVNGELVSKLDSKTAKNGDSVVVQTKTSIKTPDGTEIPKGSKLVGHVIAAQPSQPGQNSQLALQFDRVELKGGKTMPVHTQIQSISQPGGAASASESSATGSGTVNGSPAAGSNPSTSRAANDGSGAAPGAGGAAGPTSANGVPPPGTVVAKTGQIAISTTSIPGVLVANNAPGQRDPRMADASSILLGAKQDIQLDGGTLLVVGVSPSGAGAQ